MEPLDYNICLTLLKIGKLTRAELRDELICPRVTIYDNLIEGVRIPRTTLYQHLFKLEKRGFVTRSRADSNGKVGQPKVYWQFTKEKID